MANPIRDFSAKITLVLSDIAAINQQLASINPIAQRVEGIEQALYHSNLRLTRMVELMEQVGAKAERAAQQSKKVPKALDEVPQALRVTAAGIVDVNGKLHKTTLVSQQFIRVIQDAPFGPMGWINNVQELAMAFNQLKKEGISTGVALRGIFKNMMGGMMMPLAVAGITSLALMWKDIGRYIDNAKVALGLLTRQQAAYNAELKKSRESEIGELFGGATLTDLRQYNDILTEIVAKKKDATLEGLPANDAPAIVRNFSHMMQRILPDFLLDDDGKRRKVLAEQAKEMEDISVAMAKNLAMREAEIQAKAISLLLGIGEKAKEAYRNKLVELGDATNEILNETARLNARTREDILAAEIDGLIDGYNRKVFETDKKEREILDLKKQYDEAWKVAQTTLSGDDLIIARRNYHAIINQLQDQIAELRRQKQLLETQLDAGIVSVTNKALLERENDLHSAQLARFEALHEAMQRNLEADSNWRNTKHQRELESIANEEAYQKSILESTIAHLDKVAQWRELSDTELAEKQIAEERLTTLEDYYRQLRLEKEREYQREKRDLIISGTLETLSELSSASQSFFDIWQKQRGEELSRLGYTEAEKNEIIQREGKRRFEMMKALQYAEAVGSAISAGISIYEGTIKAHGGAPWAIALAGVQAAGVVAGLMAKANQIRNMTIGGSAGSSSFNMGSIGGFTTLNPYVVADRAANYETERSRDSIRNAANNSAADQLTNSIERMGNMFVEALRSTPVVVGDREAERIFGIGNARSAKFNG